MRMSSSHRLMKAQQGFTLIELVITIAIIAIIAAMAAPSMQKQIRQAKIKDGANIIEAASSGVLTLIACQLRFKTKTVLRLKTQRVIF